MTRFLWLAVISAAGFAQQPAGSPTPPPAAVDTRPALEQVAEKRSAEWDALSKALEGKIARMLPCDARVRASLEEVSRASEARLSAISRYLEAAAAQAKNDAENARKALALEDAAIKDSETDRVEAEQQRAAIDGQLADLAESAKRRQALDDARNKLNEIRARVEQDIARARDESDKRTALRASLQQLAAGYEARRAAIAAELSALASEAARWSEYYTARLARAQTECSITNQAAPQRKK